MNDEFAVLAAPEVKSMEALNSKLEVKIQTSLDHEHVDWGYYDVKSLPHPMEDNLRFALELKV